ncbi:MAG: Opr family porin [Aliarcobacter sp.]|nr:Opr family porin [Aliarcobacter sp.]
MGDYHEAVVAAITAIPDTTVVLGYTDRKAESGIDLSEDFHEFNGNKGAYVIDVKYTGLEGIEFNPYYYSAPDVADWYGLKTTFTADMFGVLAHYAISSEDTQDDGSIGHLELNTSLAGISAAFGYIKTDKDTGAGSMLAAEGDNISPFEDGNQVYEADARTIYGSLGYTIADLELGVLYGQSTYGSSDDKEKELNLTATYPITESLAASILYGDVTAELSDGDYNKVLASVETYILNIKLI